LVIVICILWECQARLNIFVANKAFVVRAVNAHDDLLAACRMLYKKFPPRQIAGCFDTTLSEEEESIVNSAIALAEGRKPSGGAS
jgi:hypothetical protein